MRFWGGWLAGVVGGVVGDLVDGLADDLDGFEWGLRFGGGLWWVAMSRMVFDTSSGKWLWMVVDREEICSSTLSSCSV